MNSNTCGHFERHSLLLVLKTEALMSKHACLGSLLLDLEDKMSSWTENYFYSSTCNNTHINRSHRLAPFTWHTPVLSPETEPCTWVRLACLCSVRDNSRFTRAKSHTARMHTAARSRCWEIPSKKFHSSSPLWTHSWVFHNISQLKWKPNLQLWGSFEDPVYPEASNKSSQTEDTACKLISLLDFLDAAHSGNVRELEGTGRGWDERNSLGAWKYFF